MLKEFIVYLEWKKTVLVWLSWMRKYGKGLAIGDGVREDEEVFGCCL